MKRIVLYAFLTGILCFAPVLSQPPNNSESGPIPGKFIVKLKAGALADQVKGAMPGSIGLQKAFPSHQTVDQKFKGEWDRFYIVNTTDHSLRADDIARMLGRGNIEYVEQDCYVQFDALPVDSLFSNQWYLYNAGQAYLGIEHNYGEENDILVYKTGTPGYDVRLVDYYNAPPSDQTTVVVAVLDTGVDPTHPDLQGQFWSNPQEIPGNDLDDDHNGYVDDTLGWDLDGDYLVVDDYVGDNDPTDLMGHGTHIAGIIAAVEDEHGIVGIAPRAKIMALSFHPSGSIIKAVEGLIYAVNNGAQIVNISWGISYELAILKEAVEYARLNNVFLSISAGNTGDNARRFPAAYDSAFAVGASNSDGFLTGFTTWGAHVDLVAPGLDILSLRADGTDMYISQYEPNVHIVGDDSLYYLADGTSMSAPMVAGAAALLLAIKPDITLNQLEDVLRLGGTDIVDPFNSGEYLPGPDTISGYGSLNIDASISMLGSPHLVLVEPQRQVRYTDDVTVKAGPIGGYDNFWMLEWSHPAESPDWHTAATASTIPADSVLHVFDDQLPEGLILLKLTNSFGTSFCTSFFHVRTDELDMALPVSGESYESSIPIAGTVHGPGYDSVAVYASYNGTPKHLASFTGEYFDSLIYNWILSGDDTGMVTVSMVGYFDGAEIVDTATVHGQSAFVAGWPRSMGGGSGAISPVCADLDRDGVREIIIATSNGLCVFRPDGSLLDGFPVMIGVDMRCVPAIYDVDRDGRDEIICTNANGIHVFRCDGSYAPGWPVGCYTGWVGFGYGYPTPTIARLGLSTDSAIVIVNNLGQILAYRFEGSSYFYSLEGLFTSFYFDGTEPGSAENPTCDFVSSVDLNQDGCQELVGAYTGWDTPYTGFGIFDGRTGEPAFGASSPMITAFDWVVGSALADLDGDSLYEVISAGYDPAYNFYIYVKTHITQDFPGWPYMRPRDSTRSITVYPIVADLDLDDTPEIIYTSYSRDSCRLYIFNADGTAYAQLGGEPTGVAFVAPGVFGTPAVANLLGDEYPEIAFRSGFLMPGTGREMLHLLDYNAVPVPDWPIVTPTSIAEVTANFVAPLVDDIDGDDLVELLLVGDNGYLFAWNFWGPYDDGANKSRFLLDNLNSNQLPMTATSSTGIADGGLQLPRTVALAQNYPNPFNPVTAIKFDLPQKGRVLIEIFNILGQKVTTLADGEFPAGRHEVEFDGSGYASGLYLYRLSTDQTTLSRKMVLLK